MRTIINRLTDLELSIMKVMWDSGKPLTVQDIAKQSDKLSIASVTQSMKHLLFKKAVKVQEHVLMRNVYARTFVPMFTAQEYFDAEVKRLDELLFGGINE